ncbi:uncharacterized protein LOC135943555 [Cloeon dipterum]|uniref:uncharacterized protein LOC135943555 n=1 Tax=Cloeon dipterum TaxID=197152 RepID=UPI00322099E6
MDWYKAKVLCESNKMHLASPKTEAENSAIYEHLKSLKIFDSLWLSASDVGRMGQGFVWHDGEELAKDSPLWDTDSPYSMGADFGEEFCVTTGRKLREQMCVDEKFFVCELPAECY